MGVVWKEEFKFATTHIIAEDMPEITALSDGRFLATWRTGEFSGGDIFNYSDIRARIFNADGTPLGMTSRSTRPLCSFKINLP